VSISWHNVFMSSLHFTCIFTTLFIHHHSIGIGKKEVLNRLAIETRIDFCSAGENLHVRVISTTPKTC
jgi:hypothetical protein